MLERLKELLWSLTDHWIGEEKLLPHQVRCLSKVPKWTTFTNSSNWRQDEWTLSSKRLSVCSFICGEIESLITKCSCIRQFLSYFISLHHFFLSSIEKYFSIGGGLQFLIHFLSIYYYDFFTENELKITETIDYSLQPNHCLKQIVGPRSLLNFNQITFGQVRIREIVLHKWSRGKSMNNNDLTPHCQPWWSSMISSEDTVT